MKDNKNPQWQKGGNLGQGQQQDKKNGSCECPVGGGNSQHKGGSHRDERGKNNQPNNENNRSNSGGSSNSGSSHEGKNRKFENE